MERKYPHIFEPITIGARGRWPGIIYKNRIFTAPTGVHLLSAGEPYPNEAVIDHYRETARGGAACITFSAQNMDRTLLAMGDNIHSDPDIFNERYHNYWYRLTSAVHFFDARISLELLAFCRHEELDGEVVCWSVNGENDEETGEYCPMMDAGGRGPDAVLEDHAGALAQGDRAENMRVFFLHGAKLLSFGIELIVLYFTTCALSSQAERGEYRELSFSEHGTKT